MGILKKIFLALLVVILVLFVALSIFLAQNGKALIEEKLSEALQTEVHVGEARVIFPAGLRFENVEVKDRFTAKTLRMRLGIPIFFGGQFNIAKITLVDPVFFITRRQNNQITWGGSSLQAPVQGVPPQSTSAATPSRVIKKSSSGIMIDFLEIRNGSIRFVEEKDHTQVHINAVNLKALSIPVPARSIKSKFDLDAQISPANDVPFAGRKVEIQGTVNLIERDMEAVLKVVDPDGNPGVTAKIVSIKNDMTLKGKINVGRFVAGVQTKSSKESSLEGFLSSALESSGVEIGIDFMCQTKMDQFNCDKLSMSGNVVQRNKGNVAVTPAENIPAPSSMPASSPGQ